jgi:PPE-repeat protein
MDFGTLPPEITAALIHSGPGAGSLIEASGVWQQLGTELEESLPSYASVLSSLTDAWQGPSWAAMTQAVEPFLTWLRATAGQCQRVGSSMEAAAAAFELAHRTVVFPVQVSANRTRLVQLLATNWFGTNLVAIADTEAQYDGMWVDNSAAMFRYQAASARALALPQFSSPPEIVNPAGAAAQASVVPTTAAASPTASTLGSILTSLLSTPGGFNPQAGWFGLANIYAYQFIASGFPINLLGVLAQLETAKAFQALGGEVGQGLAEGGAALGAAEADLAGALRAVGPAPTAAVGVGVSVGKLTMPPSVVGLLPASQPPVQLASAAFPLSSGGLPSTSLPPLMMPPRVSARDRKREGRDYENIELGLELIGTVMQRPPSAG